jgi:hypothetical protein
MLKKLLLGTAAGIVLAASLPHSGPANAADSDITMPDDMYNIAHQDYELVKNAECRTPEVELVILALTDDVKWMQAFVARVEENMNQHLEPDPGQNFRVNQLQVQYRQNYGRWEDDSKRMAGWLDELKNKSACPTPDAPAPAIPGGGQQPIGPVTTPPSQVDVPQPQNPDSPPGTCPVAVNAIIDLIRLDLSPDDVVQPTPAPYWEKVTIGNKCVWDLLYYVTDAEGGYWKSFLTEVPCTDRPPGISAGGQYCPPASDSTGLYSPEGDGTQERVERSTPPDPIATPSQPQLIPILTPPDASDHLLNGGRDSDRDPRTEDKTSEKSRPNDNSDKSNSKSTGKADKSARTTERTNAKAENNSEHATRTVTHEKAEVSHQVARTSEAGHVSGVHEGGMHAGRLGGMHGSGLGGFGGMHGGGLGGVGGILLGGFGRL